MEVETDISFQAVTPQKEPLFRPDFELRRELPEDLAPLDAISRNFYWSWRPEGCALFRDIDPRMWDKVEQSPRALLSRVCETRLWQKANDAAYLDRVNRFSAELDDYLTASAQRTSRVAYFCAEYGVHNSLPNYSGGLGILAGDHLKSASDLDVPLVAIGLLYRYGYFRQHIGHDGWQVENYNDVFESELALAPAVDDDSEHVIVTVPIRGRDVAARVWLAQVGRIRLYLLDTNVPQNGAVDRLITGHLYGGDSETRIVQEEVLGIGGIRLLRRLGIDPQVYHLNEGHAAFSTLELAREYLETYPASTFADAVDAVKPKCVFTTHTPVAAGNDVFDPRLVVECFSKDYIDELKLTQNEFLSLGRAVPSDDNEFFGMTPLAIRMCRSSNGVSAKHGEVSRELWLKMFPDKVDAAAVPITSVTNGVHAPTWMAPTFQHLYATRSANWRDAIENESQIRELVDQITDEQIWSTHQNLKALLIAMIRERTFAKKVGDVDTIHEHIDTHKLFSRDVLTIGFARRVAAYKRWDLLFTDLERLLKMVDDPDRPVQFVFAGKAHPQDKTAKTILQELMSINHDSTWQERAVFLEDYDQEIARYLVQGVDVWMNVPRRPLEASGTSGMKAAMNGVLNFSVLDGWWIEGYNAENGFAIGPLGADGAEKAVDASDAEALYAALETELIPAYYSRDGRGLPDDWIGRMRNALVTLTPNFSSDRMVRDYLTKIYNI